ncbi:hypothetical protein SARC_12664 [Sphaeroforma arctica JP610]|uniref:Major facilitator superfamily (MFS) profile domain-containing protein n=1 Tax=Sphaeroforma arctica JP610 TaxID=667725 RepID=A0A0L0FFH5_9EUKA|nr:hypothetical protein SARC_12664 [Sphaeroforma arctica JP610]KNC74798.1 hypothetical protein SARC_12664 [Sphaeroforma arctica JP610]|eukprot:XP_014148700.1 hypothetical protein SARC_12664 [Sphaeroforma arctica JP610]
MCCWVLSVVPCDSWGWRSLFFWPSVSVVLGAVFIKKYCADPLHYNVHALHLPTVANSTSSAVMRRLTTLQVFQVAGVVQLSMALFFAKMARYGLMLWLPYYSVTVLKFTPALGANLSLAFELGGAFGSPFAVVVCDRYLKSRLVTGVVLYQVLAAVSLVGFLFAGSDEVPLLFVLTTASGVALNSTDLLISGPIAAHIGRANGGIEASVGGVVNGMGSCGAIFQGLLIGWVSVSFGWDAVLKGAAGVSALAGLIAVSAARIEQLHSL